MKYIFSLLTMILFLVKGWISLAEESPFYPNSVPHTPESIMELAYDGAQYLKQTGDIAEFNKKEGKFTQGNILDYRFVMIFDCDSLTMLAHSFIPQVVGKKGVLKKTRDTRGELHNAAICRAVEKVPEGAWNISYQLVPRQKFSSSMVMFGIKIKETPYTVVVLGRQIELLEEELNAMVIPWVEKKKVQ